jgi:peptidoglycan/LPS O-acetylase OafA/YrhL
MSKERSAELDSIRGIAAFVVVLHHCWQSVWPTQKFFPFADAAHPLARVIAMTPLRLLFAGHAAVGIFFVLSGYVLAQSLARVPMTCAKFAVRRICRIWLPFVVAILGAALLYICVAPQPLPDHDWLNMSWNVRLTWHVVLGHILMIDTPANQSLDAPMWSLIHEMRLSLVFPFLVLATTCRPRITFAATLTALVVLSSRHVLMALGAGAAGGGDVSMLVYSLCQTARYSAFFVAGILLSQRPGMLPSGTAVRSALWVLSFAMLCTPYIWDAADIPIAAGSFLLIALCLQSAIAHAVLAHRLPRFLGKISYSLYLLHLPIILAFEHTLYGKVNEWAILALAVAASIPVAAISYRYVELPTMRLGKALAASMPVSPA